MRSPVFEIGIILVLMMELDYNISTALITGTKPRSDTSTIATQGHGHNDTCIDSGPEGQCSTVDARCLVYEYGMDFKCRCTEEDYFNQANDSCLKRPVAPISISIKMTYVNNNDFIVSWTGINSQTDFRVIVFVQSLLKQTLRTVNLTWNAIDTFYKVEGLKSGTEYTCLLYLEKNSIRTILLDSVSNYTGPEPVKTLRFEAVREKNFTVVWDNDPDRPCKSYDVSLNTHDKRVTIPRTNATPQRYTFTNLTGGTRYVVTITAEVPGQSSKPLNNSSLTKPEPATNVTVTQVLSNTVILQLIGPETHKDGYKIYVMPHISESVVNLITSTNDTTRVGGLEPGIEYTFKVYTYFKKLESERYLTMSAYTRPTHPTTADFPADDLHETSLTVTWNAVTNGNVDGYLVYLSNTNKPFNGSSGNTTATFRNLTTGTKYTVNIYSYWRGEKSYDSLVRTIYTKPEAVRSETITANQSLTNSFELAITWAKPTNGSVGWYEIQYECTSPKNPINMDLNYTNRSNTTTSSVSGLDPGSVCTVNITSHIGNQHGATTQKRIDWSTGENAPTGVPINVTQSMSGTSNTTLSLTWYPPLEEQQNGIITYYTVYIRYNNRTCYGEPEGNELYKQMTVKSTVGNASNSVDIPDLFPFWVYSIAVSASTVAGEGPNTAEVTMMTNQSAPDVIRSAPSTVNTSSSSIDLEWEHPCYVNGIITKYRIHVFSLDNNTTVTVYETQTNETRDVIGDLKPYHNYTISVAAINTDNETGPALNTTGVLLTNTGVPFKPTNIRPSAVSAKSLKIQWDKPSLYTGITMYNITMKDVSNSAEFHVSTGWDFNHNETVVTGLDEYWNYTVTVTAITRVGTNTSLKSTPTQTREAAPGRVVNLNLTTEMNVTKSRSIHVVWEKPAPRDLNGVLTSYFVKYTSGTQGINVTESIDVDKNNLTISDIKPGPYNVTVFAATSAGNGTIVKEEIIVPAGAPLPKPENASVPLMKEASAVGVEDDETQIAIELPTDFLCDDSNGQPIQYGLIVTSADHASDEQFVGSKADFDKKIEATYKNWFQIRDMDKPTPYITTPENWLPCQKRRKRDVTLTLNPYSIGAGGECSGIPADQNCNGQLKPATSYRIKSYVCTAGGCSETLYSAPIKTKSKVSIFMVAFFSGIGISFVAFGVVIYLKRKREACFAKAERNDTHGASDTIDDTEMVTKTTTNKEWRNTSEREESNPYDFIGIHEDEGRSAYYNIDRNQYDVLERSNDPSHVYVYTGSGWRTYNN